MTISTDPKSTRGFSLVELMVATVLGGLVLAGVLATNLQLVRGGVRMTQYAEMSAQVRRGIEQLEGDLKSASALTWNNASDLTLTIPTPDGATRQVTYAWTSATQAFFMVPGTNSAATTGRVHLVRDIPQRPDGSPGVVFARYDRDGDVAITDLATKRVQVTLFTVRSARTAAEASQTAVSAIFVLRNKPAA